MAESVERKVRSGVYSNQAGTLYRVITGTYAASGGLCVIFIPQDGPRAGEHLVEAEALFLERVERECLRPTSGGVKNNPKRKPEGLLVDKKV